MSCMRLRGEGGWGRGGGFGMFFLFFWRGGVFVDDSSSSCFGSVLYRF